MASALFELDSYKDLPLWAQVLMASRLVRRAVLALPADVAEKDRQTLLAGCDALDRCAQAGARPADDLALVNAARDLPATRWTYEASQAMYYAADAAHAAEASYDFSAAEPACSGSTYNAMAHASQSPGMSALQTRIFAAADLDMLRFNCAEFRVGRYDGLGSDVMQRLHPVFPPPPSAQGSPDPMADDPTHGAR